MSGPEATPFDHHLRRIKRYRTLAMVVLGGMLCYAMFPHMNHATRSARDAADVVASVARNQATHRLQLSAFELGKSVADCSALQLLDARAPPAQGAEEALSQARATLGARLAALQLSADSDTLDLTWKPGTFDSPTATLLGNTLAGKYGEPVRAAYSLGTRLTSFRWRVAHLPDTLTWSMPGVAAAGAAATAAQEDAVTVLASLDDMTFKVIGRIAPDEFQPPSAVADLIRSQNDAADSALLHLYSLDIAVQTRLAH